MDYVENEPELTEAETSVIQDAIDIVRWVNENGEPFMPGASIKIFSPADLYRKSRFRKRTRAELDSILDLMADAEIVSASTVNQSTGGRPRETRALDDKFVPSDRWSAGSIETAVAARLRVSIKKPQPADEIAVDSEPSAVVPVEAVVENPPAKEEPKSTRVQYHDGMTVMAKMPFVWLSDNGKNYGIDAGFVVSDPFLVKELITKGAPVYVIGIKPAMLPAPPQVEPQKPDFLIPVEMPPRTWTPVKALHDFAWPLHFGNTSSVLFAKAGDVLTDQHTCRQLLAEGAPVVPIDQQVQGYYCPRCHSHQTEEDFAKSREDKRLYLRPKNACLMFVFNRSLMRFYRNNIISDPVTTRWLLDHYDAVALPVEQVRPGVDFVLCQCGHTFFFKP